MDGEAEGTAKKQHHLAPWQFKKGVSGNPAGRPPGPSLKEWAKSYLATLTDEEKLDFVEGLDKKTIWEMAEGRASSNVDLTSGGEKIMPVLVKFLDEKPSNGDTVGV